MMPQIKAGLSDYLLTKEGSDKRVPTTYFMILKIRLFSSSEEGSIN